MDYAIRSAKPSEYALLPDIERSASTLFDSLPPMGIDNHGPTGVAFIEACGRAGAVFVATADDRPVGFALVGFLDRALHIHELDVAAPHGRRGLGRRLVEQACAFAAAEGAPAVTLSTFRDVPWNAPFYRKLGFHFVPQNQWTPAFIMLHHREMELGLPVERRGFMRKDL
jgi:GNAT superfamily N-acetyltransferase